MICLNQMQMGVLRIPSGEQNKKWAYYIEWEGILSEEKRIRIHCVEADPNPPGQLLQTLSAFVNTFINHLTSMVPQLHPLNA